MSVLTLFLTAKLESIKMSFNRLVDKQTVVQAGIQWNIIQQF